MNHWNRPNTSRLTRVATSFSQGAANLQPLRIVEMRQGGGGATSWRQRDDSPPFGAEMVGPSVGSWVEEDDVHYDHICRQLTQVINEADSLCRYGLEAHEVPSEYLVQSEEPQTNSATRKPDSPRS